MKRRQAKQARLDAEKRRLRAERMDRCKGTAGTWRGHLEGTNAMTCTFVGSIFKEGTGCKAKFKVTWKGGWIWEYFNVRVNGNRILMNATRFTPGKITGSYSLENFRARLNAAKTRFTGTWKDAEKRSGTIAFFKP